MAMAGERGAAGSYPQICMQGLAEPGRELRTQSSFKWCADPASWMVWDEFLSSLGGPVQVESDSSHSFRENMGLSQIFLGRGTDF